MIVGITGCILRVSASGNVIDMVRTDPRLVPTHNVGNKVDGSGENDAQKDQMKNSTPIHVNRACTSTCDYDHKMSQVCLPLTTFLGITISKC